LAPAMWQAVFTPSPAVNATLLDRETVLLNLESGVYFTLNAAGTVVWELLAAGRTLEEVLSALCARYDISEETARADLTALLAQLCQEGLVLGGS
jgi:hypothetical protein